MMKAAAIWALGRSNPTVPSIIVVPASLSGCVESCSSKTPSTVGAEVSLFKRGHVIFLSVSKVTCFKSTSSRWTMYTDPSNDIFFLLEKEVGVFFMSNAHLMKLVFPAFSSPTTAMVTSGKPALKGSCRQEDCS